MLNDDLRLRAQRRLLRLEPRTWIACFSVSEIAHGTDLVFAKSGFRRAPDKREKGQDAGGRDVFAAWRYGFRLRGRTPTLDDIERLLTRTCE